MYKTISMKRLINKIKKTFATSLFCHMHKKEIVNNKEKEQTDIRNILY